MTEAAFPGYHLHPDVWLLAAALAGGYHVLVKRGAAEGKVTTAAQKRLWYAGVAVLFAMSSWPMHDLSEEYLFSAHMIQHTALSLVLAPLLILGTPTWLARRLLGRGRRLAVVRALSRPLPGVILFNGFVVFTHWPEVVDLALRSEPAHFLLHVALVGISVLMFLAVLSPLPEVPRIAPAAQMMYLFVMSIVPTVPASFLTLSEGVLYDRYATFDRLWGVTAITDQRVAGLIMKLAGGFILWGFIAVAFFRWANREQRADLEARRIGVHRVGDDEGTLTWDEVQAEFERLGLPPTTGAR